jgi:SAM-dependent methyltransferase
VNISGVIFAATNLNSNEIEGKRVLEVGSCNVNGSFRPIIEKYGPREYIGVDIALGPGVDIKCDVIDLIPRFGKNSFDLVFSAELLEHVGDWRKAISSLKEVCKPGGVILITTRSFGFFYHGFPHDYWRYEVEDMEYIFGDCIIKKLEKDPQKGVLIKCIKPDNLIEKDISNHKLYSIICGRRIKELPVGIYYRWRMKMLSIKENLRYYIHKAIDIVFSY